MRRVRFLSAPALVRLWMKVGCAGDPCRQAAQGCAAVTGNLQFRPAARPDTRAVTDTVCGLGGCVSPISSSYAASPKRMASNLPPFMKGSHAATASSMAAESVHGANGVGVFTYGTSSAPRLKNSPRGTPPMRRRAQPSGPWSVSRYAIGSDRAKRVPWPEHAHSRADANPYAVAEECASPGQTDVTAGRVLAGRPHRSKCSVNLRQLIPSASAASISTASIPASARNRR